MPLKNDLSHLPTAFAATSQGVAPDTNPRYIGVLVDAWAATNDPDKPTANGTRIRHSDAGKCARAIAYTAAGIPKSDPMDLAGIWNVSLGTLLHEAWQQALQDRYPDAEIEVKVGFDGLDASGHIDAVIHGNGRTIVYELKSIGGYGFKAAIGKARRGTPAEGPKVEHILQTALNASAHGADEMVIGYLAKECLSVNVAGGMPDLGRFAAEWTFAAEEFEPWAATERARLAGILELVDQGQLAARKFPNGLLPPNSEIVDPATGRWEQHDADGQITDTGTFWACGYCNHRTVCATTASGRVAVADVPVELRGAA